MRQLPAHDPRLPSIDRAQESRQDNNTETPTPRSRPSHPGGCARRARAGGAVLGTGFGWFMRSTAALYAVLVVFIVVPALGLLLPPDIGNKVLTYLPHNARKAIMATTASNGQLGPWTGLVVSVAWIVITMTGAALWVRFHGAWPQARGPCSARTRNLVRGALRNRAAAGSDHRGRIPLRSPRGGSRCDHGLAATVLSGRLAVMCGCDRGRPGLAVPARH